MRIFKLRKLIPDNKNIIGYIGRKRYPVYGIKLSPCTYTGYEYEENGQTKIEIAQDNTHVCWAIKDGDTYKSVNNNALYREIYIA